MKTRFEAQEIETIHIFLNTKISLHQDKILSFKEKIDKAQVESGYTISHTLQWGFDDVVRAESFLHDCLKINTFFETMVKDDNKIKFYGQLRTAIINNINDLVRYNTSRSTNPISNVIEDEQNKAKREFLSLCIDIYNNAIDHGWYEDLELALQFESDIMVGLGIKREHKEA